jgi:Ca-activated chloride channel family protein
VSKVGNSKGQAEKRRRIIVLTVVASVLAVLVACVIGLFMLVRYTSDDGERRVALRIAYSPDKEAIFTQLVQAFNESNPRLSSGKRVEVIAEKALPEKMIQGAQENRYQALNPDSSVWLAEVEGHWRESSLVGDTTRYMVSPVVIAMWEDVAASLGYPDQELGWQDILRAATENPSFTWSHPSTSSASGLLATLAQFYAGAGVTRGLTEEMATDQATLDYVARLQNTVKHYAEGELGIMQHIDEEGPSFLDAFVVQEQMVIRYNATHEERLLAIYPLEGSMWADHPLVLPEHPQRTDEERLAYGLFRDHVLTEDAQRRILRSGYRPTDLSISLDTPDSPFTIAHGVDPQKPYTTMQIPSPSVIQVVKDAWWYTKRHTNVYLVVDVSGSMRGDKIADAKAALQLFLDQIEGKQERVGLIAFASQASERVPLTQLGEGRGDLERAVDGLSPRGDTALLDGVALAFVKLRDLADAERINAIVVMTDGKENMSRTSLNALTQEIQLAAQSEMPVFVFCIAYGDDADFRVLESLSDASGGFTERGDTETIRTLYKTLSSYF